MRNFLEAVAMFTMRGAIVTAVVVWMDDRPNQTI